MSDQLHRAADLDAAAKAAVVAKKAACPFIGSAVAQGSLTVLNDAQRPLARIEEVRQLGNTGGGDLGDVLAHFASGNHAFMPGDSGTLDRPVPAGLFSLDLPGSQGSHPGHSGILEGDPESLESGRFDPEAFARLTRRARDGWIARSGVGAFIAENLVRDPKSKVLGVETLRLLAVDAGAVLGALGPALLRRLFGSDDDARAARRKLEEELTDLAGEQNLVGSAGEFGLLFAFLENRPGAREVDGEPAVAVVDLEDLFVRRRLPPGWDTWKKTRAAWVKHTSALALAAGKAYAALKRT